MIRKIGMLGRTYRYANRYLEIIRVLTKYGFADLVSQSRIENAINFGKRIVFRKPDQQITTRSHWERMRLVLEELGPTFIKLGQIMSTRADLVPKELLFELEKLQDSVPPFPGDEAVDLVEQELEKPINEIFNSFSKVSVAAASLAQVHKATLLNGEEVAVKVQRPGINRMIETDLEIMFHLATMMEKHIPEMKSYSLVKIVEEYESSIRKELNFANEASNLEQFGANFQKDTDIYIPQCYRDYTTKKILTLEYIDGIKFSDINDSNTKEFDPKVIADRGADSILKQIFEYGFFHADPHPGNLLILPENVICFLDYGMMGTLTQNTRQLISAMLIGAINRDAEKIVRSVLRLCEADGEVNVLKLELQVTELINRYFYASLEKMNIPAMLNDMLSFFPDNNLKIPSDFYLLGRALILFQGNGEKLDPDFNVAKYVKPYAMKIIKDRIHIRKLVNNMYFSTEEMVQLINDLPYEIREISEKIKNGKIKMAFEHKGLEPMLITHERISNRMVFSIVLASIVIGSSLVTLSKIPPLWRDIPVIGIAGFLASVILGFGLLISIIRHNKM